jgi:hypothetical protein
MLFSTKVQKYFFGSGPFPAMASSASSFARYVKILTYYREHLVKIAVL